MGQVAVLKRVVRAGLVEKWWPRNWRPLQEQGEGHCCACLPGSDCPGLLWLQIDHKFCESTWSVMFPTVFLPVLNALPGTCWCCMNNLFNAQRKEIKAFCDYSGYLLRSLVQSTVRYLSVYRLSAPSMLCVCRVCTHFLGPKLGFL